MKGLGTDEDAIIGVWPKRTNAQRQELKKMYKTMYNKVINKSQPLFSQLHCSRKCIKAPSHTAIAIAKAMSLKWVHSISILLFTFSNGEHQRKSNVAIAIAVAVCE